MSAEKAIKIWLTILTTIIIIILALDFLAVKEGLPKLGYVKNAEIVGQYLAALEVQNQFNGQQELEQGNVDILQTELDSLKNEFNKNNKEWGKSKTEKALNQIQQKEIAFNTFAQAAQQKLSKLEKELMTPVYEAIDKGIADYGEKHGYTFIFGTRNGNIVYAVEGVDLTEEVLKYLNK